MASSSSTSSSIGHITYTKALPSNKDSPSEGSAATLEESEKRLWLGNLDPKLTEFHLLKLVQKYGSIDHFDFLFHRSGPNIGLPRGYAFVEFKERDSAEKCMYSLDGMKVLDRHLAVRWAHLAVKDYPDEQTKLKAKLPALGNQETESQPPMSKEKAICAIEAKLRAMEREKNETFNLTGGGNKTASTSKSYYGRTGGSGVLSKSSSSYIAPQTQNNNYNYRKHYQKPYDRKPYSNR